MENKINTNNKVVLITGATSALGKCIAKVFAQRGYSLALMMHKNDSEKKELDNFMNDLQPKSHYLWFKDSLSNFSGIEIFVKDVINKFGQIDVLVNNAGKADIKPVIRYNDSEYAEIMDINLNGHYFLCKQVLKNMIKKNEGHIIHVSSIQSHGGAFNSVYSASKAALIGLSKSIALEYGKSNICSNVIFPGYLESAMTEKDTIDFKEKIKNDNCLKRLNDPNEVASFIAYLASMQNVSGQVFNLDSRIIGN